jgi:hypothetical protein
MSSRYTADGKRKSSMTHAQRGWTCPCGRKVWGNGGKASHKRACRTWAEHWLPRLENLLAENEMPETRHRLEAERDELRKRLGIQPDA